MRTPETYLRLAEVVESLFHRWPSLVGFSVQEAPLERELVLSDIVTSPWPAESLELCGAIAVALRRLIDDEPEARELLHGRTFARTLH